MTVTERDEIVAVPDRVIKVEFPLSAHTDVYLIFNGPIDEPEQFQRLHDAINLLEASLLGKVPAKEAAIPTRTHRPRRKINSDGSIQAWSCDKHPDGRRNEKSGRCRECEIIRGQKLARERVEWQNGQNIDIPCPACSVPVIKRKLAEHFIAMHPGYIQEMARQ